MIKNLLTWKNEGGMISRGRIYAAAKERSKEMNATMKRNENGTQSSADALSLCTLSLALSIILI
jgi:hypothetical protein